MTAHQANPLDPPVAPANNAHPSRANKPRRSAAVVDLPIPDRPPDAVAGYTVDIGPPAKDNIQRVQELLYYHIDRAKAKSGKGVWSVVSIGDKRKINKALNRRYLHIDDSPRAKRYLARTAANPAARLVKRPSAAILGHDYGAKNVMYLSFTIPAANRLVWDRVTSLMHELMHQMEFLNGYDQTPDWQHEAYRERNTAYLDEVFRWLPLLEIYEKQLMRRPGRLSKDNEWNALTNLVVCSDEMRQLEAGHGVEWALRGKLKKGDIRIWQPEHVQLWTFLGIRVRAKDILNHYASGACGPKLEKAGLLLIWRWSFADAQEKARQEAQALVKTRGLPPSEAQQYLAAVERRLQREKKAFEKKFEQLYYPAETESPDTTDELNKLLNQLRAQLRLAPEQTYLCGEPTASSGGSLGCRRRVKGGGPCWQH